MQLTSGDSAYSPLGDGTALIAVLATTRFHGRPAGTNQACGFYPTTGINSLTADASETQGAQILTDAVKGQTDGKVDPANPVAIFGYSQSSALASQT